MYTKCAASLAIAFLLLAAPAAIAAERTGERSEQLRQGLEIPPAESLQALPPGLALLREEVRAELKTLGVPLEALDRALDMITQDALRGEFPAVSIEFLAAHSPEGVTEKVRAYAAAYSDAVRSGDMEFRSLAGEVTPDYRVGRDRMESRQNGNCLTCPSYDFGPFPISLSYDTHSGSLTSGTDCNWYRFGVQAGKTYEFTTCSPGSASWDTWIEVWNPTTCAIVAQNDDSCGLQSRVIYSPTWTGDLHVKIRPYSTGTTPGAYTLAYREMPPCAGGSCTSPGATLPPPGTTCQCVNGSTQAACTSNFYNVNLDAGRQYVFTLCSGDCSGATANYDSRLRLHTPGCGLILDNDDSCGLQSRLPAYSGAYTAPSTGTYRLEVAGFTTGNYGDYTLCTIANDPVCQKPAIGGTTPAYGYTGFSDCTNQVGFDVSLGVFTPVPPVNVTWTILPPPGGQAIPSSGSTTTSTGSFNVPSTLIRPPCGGNPANFTISVTATNSCGTTTGTAVFPVYDYYGPTLGYNTLPQVECDALPPPSNTVPGTDNCDPATSYPATVYYNYQAPGNCPGNYTLYRYFYAIDCNGNYGYGGDTMPVVDTTPPVITSSTVTDLCVWPPNHNMVPIPGALFPLGATDNCSYPIESGFFGPAVSNQPADATGDGHTLVDSALSPDGKTLFVRAERQGGDPAGRTYTVEAAAIDACGNRSAPVPAGTIHVPHDQSEADDRGCIDSSKVGDK